MRRLLFLSPLLLFAGDRCAAADPPPFAERAEALGIRFRMEFLPTEQGEHFKINLYDHGCGVVAGDIDGDGRLDLAVNNFNDRAHLYMNRGPRADWIAFRLAGRRSNRDAIGAVVTIRAGGRTRVAQVQGAGGYLSQSSRTVHFGLGGDEAVEWCGIRWPGQGVQRIETPAKNRVHTVVERVP